MKNYIGIYILWIYDKCYIGQSVDIIKRYNSHTNKLIKNKHPNKKIQDYYNKYGVDNFHFEILHLCYEHDLDQYELYYITKYDSVNNGLNIGLSGNDHRRRKNEIKKLPKSIFD